MESSNSSLLLRFFLSAELFLLFDRAVFILLSVLVPSILYNNIKVTFIGYSIEDHCL